MIKKLKSAGLMVAAVVVATLLPVTGGPGVHAVSSCPLDLLSGFTPHNTNYDDSDAINAGVKFSVHGAPYVSGVKFYKGTDNTGTHVAHLYDVTASSDLDSATFSGETSSGWQSVSFSSNVQIQDDHDYIVWVSMPNGHYAVDGGLAGGDNTFDASTGHGQFGNNEDVVVIPSGNSGVYSYTASHSTVPSSATTSNYWVSPIVGDATNPGTPSGFSDSHSSSGRTVSWSSGRDTNSATSSGQTVRAYVTRQQGEIFENLGYFPLSSNSFTDPTAVGGVSYRYYVHPQDGCGNSGSGTYSFSTAGSPQSYSHVFSSDPSTTDTGQTDPVTVGLWSSSGTLLASRSLPYQNEQTGWVNVNFASPVSVSANTDYVVGYFSPNGLEEYTNSTFDNDVTNGDLTAPAAAENAPNGVYSTSSTFAFPSTASANNAWYGVDVSFYIP